MHTDSSDVDISQLWAKEELESFASAVRMMSKQQH